MADQLHDLNDPEFERYLQGQIEEIESPLNRWGAGQRFGRNPSPDELVIHYIEDGAALRYAERHKRI